MFALRTASRQPNPARALSHPAPGRPAGSPTVRPAGRAPA